MQSLDTRKWGEEREEEEKKIRAREGGRAGGWAGRQSHPRQKSQQPEWRKEAGPRARWLTMCCPAFVLLTQPRVWCEDLWTQALLTTKKKKKKDKF